MDADALWLGRGLEQLLADGIKLVALQVDELARGQRAGIDRLGLRETRHGRHIMLSNHTSSHISSHTSSHAHAGDSEARGKCIQSVQAAARATRRVARTSDLSPLLLSWQCCSARRWIDRMPVVRALARSAIPLSPVAELSRKLWRGGEV